MRKYLRFVFVVFICQCSVYSQISDTALINVRNFRIKKKRIVSIQAPIDVLKDITIKSNDNHYYLIKGAFVGVDSIDLKVDSTNRIEKVTCFYDSLTTYKYIVKAFNKHLKYKGKKTKFENKRSTTWEDKSTLFEIIEVRTGNKRKVYCEIKDREKS